MKRALAAVVGVLAVGVGVATMVHPGVASEFSVDRTMVFGVGVLALVQSYRVVRDRRNTPVSAAETPDPETEQDLPAPGEDFDELLSRVRWRYAGRRRRNPGERATRRVRNRLERAAVSTITRKWGCTPEQAREALREGAWTDDPVAAAYFTGELHGVGLGRRIRLALAAETREQRRAARAAEAIAALSAADPETVERGEHR